MSADDIAPGLERCEPWPEVETVCAQHEMRLPGEPACRPVGAACPADGWPADLPATGVVYVRPGATAPADGSRTAPHPEVAAALAALPPDTTTLALAVGEYPVLIGVTTSLTIRGACPEQTILRGDFIPLYTEGAEVIRIEDVTFRSSTMGRLTLRDVTAELYRVVFDNVGLDFDGPALVAEDIVMRSRGPERGSALSLFGVGDASLRRILIEDYDGDGVVLGGVGIRSLTDVYLRRIDGVGVSGQGDIALERVVIDDAVDNGIVTLGGGRMTDVVVRGVAPRHVSSAGMVLGGDWVLEGVHVARAASAAIIFGDGEVVVRDAILEGTPVADGSLGRAIVLGPGAALVANRIVIADARDLGILVSRDTTATVTDGSILRIGESLRGGFGRCVHGQLGAELSLTRVLLEDCTEAGVTTYGGSVGTLRDVRVSRVRPTGCNPVDEACIGAAGIGLLALGGGALDAERFVIEEAALAGVIVVEGGDIDLRDGTIRANPIGVNVQDPTYDIGRVMDRMVFTDNGTNLDSSALPLPGATAMEIGGGP
ncbi:MAG: hypothetical protein DRJ42_13720 [Deltaproteobacteria bacterium]|nr:MAG: hypothetical protein DRJ42_13720 [Deltaproteobacteria bacterium]